MSRAQVGPTLYGGLFFTTLSTLMYEILLTRIFSVTMWYHFAFLVISTAMFGMTLGAIVVYLLPRTFSRERLGYHLSLHCLLFAVSIVASFVAHVWISARLGMGDSFGSTALFLGVTYLVISVPFVFSGICVCLALTRFPSRIGALYGADLAGAALGCVALIAVLRFTDGPTAVMVVALDRKIWRLWTSALRANSGLCWISPARALNTRPWACSRSLAMIRISLGGSWVNAHHSVMSAFMVVFPDFLGQA